jgi:6-pyruvoyltetrahydropterin/6-carboxytetrahydropterin synthase
MACVDGRAIGRGGSVTEVERGFKEKSWRRKAAATRAGDGRAIEGGGFGDGDGDGAMIRLTRKAEFCAAHYYYNPAFSAEENRRVFGKCANLHGHGHNYVLEVTIAGEPDPATGMLLDLKELKEIIEREVISRMDHRSLNHEVPELAGKIPTCENVALVIWNLLEPRITHGQLDRVRLYESPELFVDCTIDSGRSDNRRGGNGTAREGAGARA